MFRGLCFFYLLCLQPTLAENNNGKIKEQFLKAYIGPAIEQLSRKENSTKRAGRVAKHGVAILYSTGSVPQSLMVTFFFGQSLDLVLTLQIFVTTSCRNTVK